MAKQIKKNKFYITTAIDYVNAKPHIGHAFEKTLADSIARWNRLQGKEVFFLTGVDENAQKNVQAAEQAGIPVKKFIDQNTALFQELCKKLNISYDKFIRTTAKEHAEIVYEVLKKVIKNNDIYKGEYEGFYCSGCESFITEKDLVDGKCPEHNREPEHMSEEAYFFKLGKYQKQLIKFISTYIIPESKKNEILSRLKEPLKDVCISRKGAKWGVDFPEDKEYKIWVWIDALINYISGAKEQWPADLHVIGKGINWFHSVIWPALLMSAEIELPKKLLVHGYLNLQGKKISKSLGNTIDPIELINKYGTDSVRYALLRCSVFEDSDFSEEIVIERRNKELANKLGNLVLRVSTLAEQNGLKKTENKLLKKLKIREIEKCMENYEVDKALSLIFEFIDNCNEYIQDKKPWETKDKEVLYELVYSIKEISKYLSCFIPETSEKINKIFKSDKIKKADILFKKIDFFVSAKDKAQNVNKAHNTLEKSNLQLTSTHISKPLTSPSSSKQKILKHEIPGIISMANVSFSDWQKLELKVGKIEKAEDIEGADKLYKLTINIGKEKKVVCAGIKKYYKKEQLKGKLCVLFVNLEPRMMKGIESQGMILAAVNEDESKVLLIQPDKDIEVGSRVS